MKKIILIAAIMLSAAVGANGQSKIRVKNHNLIFNCELISGNPYLFAASSALTGLVNYHLLNDAFFENGFAYTSIPRMWTI